MCFIEIWGKILVFGVFSLLLTIGAWLPPFCPCTCHLISYCSFPSSLLSLSRTLSLLIPLLLPTLLDFFLLSLFFFSLSFLRTPFSVVCHSSSFCQLKFNKNNPGRVTIFIRKIIYKEASLLFL